jgi:hypothetical protein
MVRLHIGGFGQDPWPVDVATDLAVAIEQVPRALSALRSAAPFQLNFFEQGIERYIAGTVHDDRIALECTSMSLGWSPVPPVEVLRPADAEKMLSDLHATFLASARQVCPPLTTTRAFTIWNSVR